MRIAIRFLQIIGAPSSSITFDGVSMTFDGAALQFLSD